jgi:hypothetical protein
MIGWASAASMKKYIIDSRQVSTHPAWSYGLAVLSWIVLYLVFIGLVVNLVCSGKKAAAEPKSPSDVHNTTNEGVELNPKQEEESKPSTV